MYLLLVKFEVFKFEYVDKLLKWLNIVVDVAFKFEICVVCPFINNIEFVDKFVKFELVVIKFK